MSQDIETPGTELDTIARPANIAPGSSALIMSPSQYDATWRMSKALAHSGSFKDIGREDASKALARIMLGADLGMSPTQALMGIDIVKGNPQIRGVALGRMVRQSAKKPTPGGESYDYAVLDRGFEPDLEYAVVALYRRNENGKWPRVKAEEGVAFPTAVGEVRIAQGEKRPEAVEAFKLDQAKKRNLIKTDGAWQTQPEVMCVWRALSQMVRFYAPDVIGGVPVYTEADGLRPELVTHGGSDPEWTGWTGLSPERAARCEQVVTRAAEVGHGGLADRHSVLMRVQGMTDAAFDAWVEEAAAEMTMAAQRSAREPAPQPAAFTVWVGGEEFAFSHDGDPYAALVAAIDSGPEEMRALADSFELSAGARPGDSHLSDDERGFLRTMAAALNRQAADTKSDTSDTGERV